MSKASNTSQGLTPEEYARLKKMVFTISAVSSKSSGLSSANRTPKEYELCSESKKTNGNDPPKHITDVLKELDACIRSPEIKEQGRLDADQSHEVQQKCCQNSKKTTKRSNLLKRTLLSDNDIILESKYKAAIDYGEAVTELINLVLINHGYHTERQELTADKHQHVFSTVMQGLPVECRIIIVYSIHTYRIELVVCRNHLRGRLPLIERTIQGINAELRFGNFVLDKKTNEIKLVYSNCYHGAFSPGVFDRYLGALLMSCREYCGKLVSAALNCELFDDEAGEIMQIVSQSARWLPDEAVGPRSVKGQRIMEMADSSMPGECINLLRFAASMIPPESAPVE